jgi:polyprenyl-phospho-N-acetylgalactosaminyl synthase
MSLPYRDGDEREEPMNGRTSSSGYVATGAHACVVIPVFNEATVIAAVVAEVLTHFEWVICVDDGSTDDSADIARSAGASVVRHPINLGQGAALRTGIDVALRRPGVSHIVTFDADGQHSVSDAVSMVHFARSSGTDVVLGSRFLVVRDGLPPGRKLLLKLAIAFTRWTTKLNVTDTHNGLRVITRSAARRLTLEQAGMAHASELLALIARHDMNYAEVPVDISYSDYSRGKGQSNLNAINILHELFAARMRVAK